VSDAIPTRRGSREPERHDEAFDFREMIGHPNDFSDILLLTMPDIMGEADLDEIAAQAAKECLK
jgi:hypothetical protein